MPIYVRFPLPTFFKRPGYLYYFSTFFCCTQSWKKQLLLTAAKQKWVLYAKRLYWLGLNGNSTKIKCFFCISTLFYLPKLIKQTCIYIYIYIYVCTHCKSIRTIVKILKIPTAHHHSRTILCSIKLMFAKQFISNTLIAWESTINYFFYSYLHSNYKNDVYIQVLLF